MNDIHNERRKHAFYFKELKTVTILSPNLMTLYQLTSPIAMNSYFEVMKPRLRSL